MSKSYSLNSPHMRRAVLGDLRLVKGWLGHLVAVWSPTQRGGIDPMNGRYDREYRMPIADLPEHNVKDLMRTIQSLESTITAATAIRNVVERMLTEITAGHDPHAARPTDPIEPAKT